MSARVSRLRRFQSEEHAEEQEEIACPLCGGTRSTPVMVTRDLLFAKPGHYTLVACAQCELRFVNPRPTPPSLGPHYPADYFGYSLHEDEPPLLQPFLRSIARGISLRRLKYLEAGVGRIQPGAKLLDVGCGVNRFLHSVRDQRGVEGLGLDFKPEIVSYVKDKLQMPIMQGSLGSVPLEDGRFDIVTMLEYLEHEPDPLAVLDEARRITRQGGHLALELPYLGLVSRIFGPNWWNYDIPRHLIFFTPKTLERVLARAGFELLHVEKFTLPLYIGMSVLQALGLRHWRKHRELYPVLSVVTGLPFLPFQALLPEFMFCVARAV